MPSSNKSQTSSHPEKDLLLTESLAVRAAAHTYGTQRLQKLNSAEAALLKYEWDFWARPNQKAPEGDWGVWLLMTGRGFGKTRAGAQWSIEQAKRPDTHIAMVGRIPADARDVMVNGESGILASSPPDFLPSYTPSQRLLKWPNGSEAHLYSSEKPADLRGPNFHCAWIDELAKYDQAQEVWDTLAMAVRLPPEPRIVVTTTPRPTPIIKSLVEDRATHVTQGSIYDNRSNLSEKFFERLIKRYEGTYLGQQELEGLLISDRPGSLWTREVIEKNRVRTLPSALSRVVVAIDPPATASVETAEAGIIAVGRAADGMAYVLADASIHGTPDDWGRAAIRLYDEFKADQIVGEVNNGGDMVGFTVRECAKALCREGERKSSVVPYVPVRASRGKLTRAEPIAALYSQGRVRHCGMFTDLEDQMTSWVPGEKSPDRLDAMVWAMTSLVIYGSDDIEVWGGEGNERPSRYVERVATSQGTWFPPSGGTRLWG
jgi:phage terminase large subunit-like protein